MTDPSPTPLMVTLERFIKKLRIDESGCWIWTGARKGSSAERPDFRFRGKNQVGSRVSYIIFRGEIPNGLLVLHTCDVPLCVNPKHLWLGTDADNRLDCAIKKRDRNSRKTRCIYGHAFSQENTFIRRDKGERPSRMCKICKRAKWMRAEAKKKCQK